MKRKNRVKTMAAAAGFAAALAMSGIAQAASVGDAIDQVFTEPRVPIILEDNNYTQLAMNDIIFGFVQIQTVARGNRANDPNASATDPDSIRNIGFSGADGATVAIGEGTDYNELTGFFAARLNGFGTNPEPSPPSTSVATQYLLPVAPGTDLTYSFDSDGDGTNDSTNTISFNDGGPAGTILQLFEDPDQNFDAEDPGTAYNTTVDGIYRGSIGFEDTPVIPTTYDEQTTLNNEYFVNYFFPGETLPFAFRMSLNFLDIPAGSPFTSVFENDTDNTFYAEGSLSASSDPDFTVAGTGAEGKVLVPTPAAVGPGIAMFAILGACYRRRNRREQVA